jgi:hypothetical protein
LVGVEDALTSWFEKLEQRHLSNLTFSEVRRAIQALSSLYVERRTQLSRNSALESAGKRAAFALFFGPLHFLLVREICRCLHARVPASAVILDIGCGTGMAGAAWALESQPPRGVIGVDRHAWALQECDWTYRQLGIRGTTRRSDASGLRIPRNTAVISAFTMNEIGAETREQLRHELLRVHRAGAPVLIVEPIARRVTSWWDEWSHDWTACGGRADEWRFPAVLPERLALMDRAAGLDHRELTGRSLWLPGSA